ncbi:MAG: N-6 DNA methylase [Candidatus Omnitrophica bacterium]|nr:N-6 DNA methylase [Candidatus Omnitrophota bacterium]
MDFKVTYEREKYLDFFQNQFLPEDFESCDESIESQFKPQHISKVTKIGQVPSLDLNIYEIKHHSENDPRVSLSRDSFRILAQYGVRRALAIFTSSSSSNYRLSLITIDLKLEGRRVQKEYSNPRRYSFFLGPDTKTHTPEEYLMKQGRIKNFEDLKNRFSIEVVNKDFYMKIAILFTQLAGGKRKIGRKSIDAGRGLLDLPGTSDDTLDKEFTVRLIGRLVFCWFLKRKQSDRNISLLPEELLSVNAVLKNKGYYHGILEPLFFEVLNTPAKDRDKKYQESTWSQIPFLNGGLFTPHHHDFYDPGLLGISKYINVLKIPDHWIKELFDVFETYNFTIDENTSVDVELSIEPEMLGRIFENLLAEINPETGETARKATGSYYTPRPIVEYMVSESLKQYLLTKTKLEENKITRLLTYEDVELKLTSSEKESILNALDVIKIIDPACGSGAFPMGILQKMLVILQKIDPESEWWLDKMLSRIGNKTLERKLKVENVSYIHKLGIIQNAIFGVDIQPIAVEISKLRFFLSLIVDETVNDSKKNRGIEPLPNLEFKFVCTNSLIGLPKKGTQQTLFEADEDIKSLRDLRDGYLRSYGSEKRKVEKRFLELQRKMAKHALGWALFGGEKSQTMKLSQWNPFSEEPCSWFDPDWMFGIKDGFDIVIANPPYIKEYVNRNAFKGFRSSLYYQGKMDIWYMFVCKSLDITRDGTGLVTFIAQNNWVTSYGASKMRNKVIKDAQILNLIDFGAFKIFESGIQTMVMVFRKNTDLDSYSFDYRRLLGNDLEFDDAIFLINKEDNPKSEYLTPTITRINFIDKTLTFSSSDIEPILEKLSLKANFRFNDKEVANGIHHHHDRVNKNREEILGGQYKVGDGIFVLSNEEKERISFTKKELGLIKPSYTTKELLRWYGNSTNKEWVIYTDSSFKNKKQIENYLNIKRHLDRFRKVITSDNKPYGLHRARDEYFFRGEKIIAARKCARPTFTYVDFDSYVSATFYVIKTERVDQQFLTGLLNSKLITFWLRHRGKMQGTNYQIDKEPIINLPILKADKNGQNAIRNIVAKIIDILKSKGSNEKQAKVKEYERQIDQMVYKLYGLTSEEMKIVEGQYDKKN